MKQTSLQDFLKDGPHVWYCAATDELIASHVEPTKGKKFVLHILIMKEWVQLLTIDYVGEI